MDLGCLGFVNRRVCQMRVDVFQHAAVVASGRKSTYALFIQKYLHRSHLSYQNINAHIPLRSSDKQRVLNVLLNNRRLVILKVANVINYSDPSTSTKVIWFTNPNRPILLRIILVSSKSFDKFLVLIRKKKCFWTEVIDVTKHVFIATKHTSKTVFCA